MHSSNAYFPVAAIMSFSCCLWFKLVDNLHCVIGELAVPPCSLKWLDNNQAALITDLASNCGKRKKRNGRKMILLMRKEKQWALQILKRIYILCRVAAAV